MCNYCPPDPYVLPEEPKPHIRPCNCATHRDDLLTNTTWSEGANDSYVRVDMDTGEILARFTPTRRVDHGVEHNTHVVQWLLPPWWLKQRTQPDPY